MGPPLHTEQEKKKGDPAKLVPQILTGKEEQGSEADIRRWRRRKRSGLCYDDMRVMVFRNGLPGEMVNMVGDYPLEEIGDLLGGQADEEMIQISRRLAVVVRADREDLPVRYMLVKGKKGSPQKRFSAFAGGGDARERAELLPWAEAEHSGLCGDEVRGDLVVVRRMMGGERLRDMTAYDGDDAQRFVEAVGEADCRGPAGLAMTGGGEVR